MFTIASVLLIVLTKSIFEVLGYEIQCPQNAQWYLRSKICNKTDSYTCLLNPHNKTYIETCDGVEIVRAGLKRVMRPNFDNEPCPSSHYQPFFFSSNGNTECAFQKSICSEVGQVEYSPGSLTTNRYCQCDYNKGYAFVTKPRELCYCNPQDEDCSCFKKQCRNSILSAAYECIPLLELDPVICPPIQYSCSSSKDEALLIQHGKTEELVDQIRLEETEAFVAIVIGIILLVFMLLLMSYLGAWYLIDKANSKGAMYMHLSIVQVMDIKATEVVRTLFDKIFSPGDIQNGKAFDRHKLETLRDMGIITRAEMQLIIPGLVPGYVPSSNAFEFRLMIELIRNFTTFTITDYLPSPTKVGIFSELSRLKYYRDNVVLMDPDVIKDQDYLYLKDKLAEINSVLKRLDEDIEKFNPA